MMFWVHVLGLIVAGLTIVGAVGTGVSWIIRRGVIDPLLTPIINSMAKLADSVNRLSDNQEKQSQIIDQRILDHEKRITKNEKTLAVHDQKFEDIEKDDR